MPRDPNECGKIGSLGMWSHHHNRHGWDKDEATPWIQRQKSGDSNDDEPDSGVSATPSNDDPENGTETPDSQPNQGDSGFQFDQETSDPSPDEDAIVVQEEGSEKLSPEGFDSRNRPEMSPPEDSDLPSDVTPDDFEPDEEAETPKSTTRANRRKILKT